MTTTRVSTEEEKDGTSGDYDEDGEMKPPREYN